VFIPAKLDINQLLTFAVWLFRRMVNHDCDGRHKICDLLSAMPKVPQCFAGNACETGISPAGERPEKSAATRRYPMHNIKSVPTAATLRGLAPAIIPAD
jgi:hypothetical protein